MVIPTLLRAVVSVDSLERSAPFYSDVVGLEAAWRTDELASFATAGGSELLLHQRPSAPSDTAVALTFALADLDAAVAKIPRDDVVRPPAVEEWGERQAVVRDPDGHLICLVAAG